MRRLQPTVGERDLWHLDLPGVLGEAPWAWGSPQVSARGWGGEGPHLGWPLSPPGSESGGGISDQASPLLCSFVRSVTMDKWKDVELEKMKAGGNARFREFLESQEDYDPCWSLQEKYNSRAAALFRDRVRQATRHVEAAPAAGTEILCGSDHGGHVPSTRRQHAWPWLFPPGGLGGPVVYWAEDGLSSQPPGKRCVQTPLCVWLKLS